MHILSLTCNVRLLVCLCLSSLSPFPLEVQKAIYSAYTQDLQERR